MIMADHSADYWALTASNHLQHISSDPASFPASTLPVIPPNFVLPLVKRLAVAAAPDAAHTASSCTRSSSACRIPIIDLAHYSDSTASQLALHRACAEWGLFHVINHGVPPAVLERMQTQIDHFLSLPLAERPPLPIGHRGQGYGTGCVRRSGLTDWRDFLRLLTFPLSARDYDAWPLSPQFRKAIEDFSDEMRALQLRVMGCLSQSLGLSASSRLEEIVGDMQQTVMMNHYPPCPQPDLAAGIDEHTDIGALTCLWQRRDDGVGLQAFHDGAWIPVAPIPGSIVVLIADQIEIASNGIYKSPLHRATLNATKRRVSVVSFYQLRPEQVVAPAAELVDEQHPPLYEPTRFADHQAAKKG